MTKISKTPSKQKMILSIALISLLAISALIATTQPVKADSYTARYPTTAFCVVSPNPIGINQAVSVVFWLGTAPPQNSNQSIYTGWMMSVEITKPNGDTETRGPIKSDAVGGAYIIYTPDSLGEYKFKATFPGQEVVLNSVSMFMGLTAGTYYFEASESREVSLTVQETSWQLIEQNPLPTGYWSNPISAENQEWYRIAGNCLSSMMSNFLAPYTTAPNTAHILWTKPLDFGGITGGVSGWGINYYNSIPYEPYFTPPVIISGRLYYNTHTQGFGTASPGVACVDLRTGALIWEKPDMPQITCGQTYTVLLSDDYGAKAYLWASSGSNWLMYDAFTGELITTVANATGSFSPLYGPQGELLIYSLDGVGLKTSLWNSTRAIMSQSGIQWSAEAWRPPATVDYRTGIQWTTTVPAVTGGTPSLGFIDLADGVMVAEAKITDTMSTSNPTFVDVGYSTKDGKQLWQATRTGYDWGFSGFNSPGLLNMRLAYGEGIYAIFHKETPQMHAFDIKTGEWLWDTESFTTYTHSDYSMYDWCAYIAYGKMFVTGYSGAIIAFDISNGHQLWTYLQDNPGYTTPYGAWPALDGAFFADNKVFLATEEHTPNTPMLRGYRLICVDAANGAKIWDVSNFGRSWAIADGVLVDYNCYDNQAYAFAKGLSATSVTATAGVGNSVTIQGTVTDQSPGQTALGIPAAGTPAISDDYMTEWMEYLYMQKSMPTDATGVPVTLFISDQSGNVINTIQTTSDISGHFAAGWTPPSQGLYTITAAFDGTNSYYASTEVTSISVGTFSQVSPQPTSTTPATGAPTTNPPTGSVSPSQPSGPTAGTDIATSIVIVAVVIIAIIAAIAVILRRRK